MDEISVKFQGFSPTGEVKTYIQELLHQLQEEAPTSAVIRAHIHRVDDSFRGVLRITSPGGEFFAIASGQRIFEVCRRLTSRIRRQLTKWKEVRFTRETIRHLPHKMEMSDYDAAN